MEMFFVFLYFFICGTCIASFVNVMIERIPEHKSFIKGRSYCPICHHQLGFFDLFPIISYIFLHGKCRYCHSQISKQYIIIEIFGGFLAVLCFYHYGYHIMGIWTFCFSMILLAISIIDLKTMEIPDGLILCCLLLALIEILFIKINIFTRLIGFFIASLPMIVINFFVQDSFGGGDIKLVAVGGFILGWQKVLIAIFLAIMTAGLYASYLMFIKQDVKRNDHIAFGPYLCFGMFMALLYGETLLDVYLSLFF